MPRQRSLRRHLLAMCTFLVPLGALAFFGQRELGRQGDQVRSAADREALQFLRTAAQALEQRFELVVPAVEQECAALLDDRTPAATVRELRARGFGAVLDLVLIGLDGRLRYPDTGSPRLALPFHRDARTRGAGDAAADTLHLVDLLLAHERFADAERHLVAALAEQEPDRERPGRRRGEQASLQIPLQFRLATVQNRLGNGVEAARNFRAVVDQATSLRANPRSGRSFDPVFDSDLLSLGLLAEVALAEVTREKEPRLLLLAAIARGERDQLGDSILAAVSDRLLTSAPAASRTEATELWTEAGIHLHARAFATDYDRLLRETVRRRLRSSTEPTTATDGTTLRPVITAGTPSSLLLLRRASKAQEERAAWIGLRLDLGQMLASAIEPFVHGDGSFVLAIADSDDQPVIAAPSAPDDYVPPALATHGMVLRAFPADVDTYLQNIGDAKRSAAMLLGGSFLVALIGAIWLWRSVSRESELLSLKVDLVSRVSHELKTPLSLISLYGETLALKRERDSDQAAQFGSVIMREAGRLTSMIQRILDFSR
ncbi:MAG: histidine kinase dimerization/phospho-acceptor domain-containing protein, partial [Planctomycetota bacterium]